MHESSLQRRNLKQLISLWVLNIDKKERERISFENHKISDHFERLKKTFLVISI